MGFVLFFVVFVIIAVVAVAASANHTQKVNAAWKEAGRRLGLVHRPAGNFASDAELTGVVSTLHVTVRLVSRGGENKSTYTRYEVTYPPSGPEVILSRQQSFGGFFRRMFGGRDIVLGDPAFDDRVIVNGVDEQAIAEFLTPGRRMVVLTLLEEYLNAEITNHRLRVETQSAETDADALVRHVHRLVDTGLVMSRPDDVDRALGLQEAGELAEATAELHQLNESKANSFTQMLEARSLLALGEPRQAEELFLAVDERLPADPVIDRWREVAHEAAAPVIPVIDDAPEHPPVPPPVPDEPVVTAEPAVAEEVTVVASPSTPPDLRQEAVIADLFVSDRMGFEVEAHFEAAYLGSIVTWTGEVDSLRDYRRDRDFGDEPGIRAKVLVGNLGNSRLVSNQVHAIVQLPSDVEIDRDATITFTGRLMRVDRYMRNLFVADATLVR